MHLGLPDYNPQTLEFGDRFIEFSVNFEGKIVFPVHFFDSPVGKIVGSL